MITTRREVSFDTCRLSASPPDKRKYSGSFYLVLEQNSSFPKAAKIRYTNKIVPDKEQCIAHSAFIKASRILARKFNTDNFGGRYLQNWFHYSITVITPITVRGVYMTFTTTTKLIKSAINQEKIK